MRSLVFVIISLSLGCASKKYDRAPVTYFAYKNKGVPAGFYGLNYQNLEEVFYRPEAPEVDGAECLRPGDFKTQMDWNANYLKDNCKCP